MEQIVKHITSEQLYQTISEGAIKLIKEDTTSTITASDVIEALKTDSHEMVDYDDSYYTIGVDIPNENDDVVKTVYITIGYEADFHITPYYAATYTQPEEGGDVEFDTFKITSVEVADEDDNTITITPEEETEIAKEVSGDFDEDMLYDAYQSRIENYIDDSRGDWDRYDDD